MEVVENNKFSFGDIADIGSSTRIFSADYVQSGIPFYRSKEIIQKSFGEEISDPLFIDREKFRLIKERYGAPTINDILISSVGNRSGIPYLVKREPEFYFKDGNLIWFKNFSEKVYSPFLFHWLKSSLGQSALMGIMIGSAQKALTIEGIKKLTIRVPGIKEQRSIASILSALDDKIELNLEMNKTLEEMAMTLYKHWFVDFGPFRDGEFVSSELGEIPKSWEVKEFSNLYDLVKGLSYKSIYYSESGIPMINLKCVDRNGGFRHDGIKYYNGEYKPQHVVKSGDLMIAMTDLTQDRSVLGSPIICPNFPDGIPVIASLDIGILKQKPIVEENLNLYFYYTMKSATFHQYILGYGNGSTVMHLDKNGVLYYRALLPSIERIKEFNEIVNGYHDFMSNNIEENQTLVVLRDTLLPKLISGEVRVKEAVKTLEEVL